MATRYSAVVLVAVGVLSGACSQAVDGASDDGVNQADGSSTSAPSVATLKLGGEHTLEVQEIAPGDFLFIESMGKGDAPLDAAAMKAQPLSELYHSLSPHTEIPKSVLQATERQLAHDAAPTKPAADAATAEVTSSELPDSGVRALDLPEADWIWSTNNCHSEGERLDVTSGPVVVDGVICKLRQHVSQWAHISKAHAAQAKVETWQGKVTVTISHNFGDGAVTDKTVTVSEGHSTRLWRWQSNDDFSMHVDVSDVSSTDLFNMALFGTASTNSDALACYDGGFHCGLGVIVQE
jgi:hypothetical protein